MIILNAVHTEGRFNIINKPTRITDTSANLLDHCGNTVNSVCCNYFFFGNSFFVMTQRKIISLSLLAANVAG